MKFLNRLFGAKRGAGEKKVTPKEGRAFFDKPKSTLQKDGFQGATIETKKANLVRLNLFVIIHQSQRNIIPKITATTKIPIKKIFAIFSPVSLIDGQVESSHARRVIVSCI